MMRADTGLHPDQARRQVGKSRLDLATRPFLPEYDRTTPIVPYDVKRVLADIDADHGDCAAGSLRHGVLTFDVANQLRSLGGTENGRSIPVAVIAGRARLAKSNGDFFEGNAGSFGSPAFARLDWHRESQRARRNDLARAQ